MVLIVVYGSLIYFYNDRLHHVSYLPPTKKEVNVLPAFVCLSCLSVCLLAYMDLDEMLGVDRCRDMDELINFWARYWLSRTGLLSPISYLALAYTRNFTSGKIPRIRIGGPPLQQRVVLEWFYLLSRRNTFVGGTCALPSALVVYIMLYRPDTCSYLTKR